MEVILYSTGCPQCNVLKNKLKEKNISFVANEDIDEMKRMNFKSAPMLKVDNQIMNFKEAFKWINGV